MTKKEFHELLLRFQNDTCTADEKAYVEKWIESIQSKEPSFLIDDATKETQLRKHIMQAIQPELTFSGEHVSAKQRNFKPWYWATAAAVIISCGIFFRNSFFEKNQPMSKIVTSWNDVVFKDTIQNNERLAKRIKLDDGSVIYLEPNGKIIVDRNFNKAKERVVFLEGNAFFKVAHDANRPFIVISKDLVTKVLGTSFTINAAQGKAESVEVLTGKVAVYHTTTTDNTSDAFVTLTPNHQAYYDRESQRLITGIVKKPIEIHVLDMDSVAASKPQVKLLKMKFKEVSPIEILKALEVAYGIKINYDASKISGCVLTVSLKDEDFYTRLQTVCDLIGGTYQVTGNEIKVTSSGCK